ncbi:porin, partial [Brucella tritici]|uniref:porin n=1 Tax=Brucella tritici TaxID=94626 RepID=UPI00124ECF5D
MNIKSLLLGSAAALVAASGAQAADAIVAPEPEAVEYVRVCDAYGAGYFYIPGTETCLRIHGYVRYDATGGDDVYARGGRLSYDAENGYSLARGGKDRDTWAKTARATLRFSTASETELGTLKTYVETRFQWADGNDSGSTGTLRFGYIQLGGLRVGLDESAFVTFPGYLGNVMNDDVILAGGYRTGLISYTFTGGNGFSAVLSLEQGNNVDVDYNGTIDDYMPHVVGGLKYAGGWGSLAAVAAYDATNEEWAGKIRADINVTDRFSVWAMGGYKSNDDTYYGYTDADGRFHGIRAIDSFYGTWGG